MSIRSKDETDLTYFTKSKEYNRIGTFFLHKSVNKGKLSLASFGVRKKPNEGHNNQTNYSA